MLSLPLSLLFFFSCSLYHMSVSSERHERVLLWLSVHGKIIWKYCKTLNSEWPIFVFVFYGLKRCTLEIILTKEIMKETVTTHMFQHDSRGSMQSKLYAQIVKTLKMDLWDDETLALLKMLKRFQKKILVFCLRSGIFREDALV